MSAHLFTLFSTNASALQQLPLYLCARNAAFQRPAEIPAKLISHNSNL